MDFQINAAQANALAGINWAANGGEPVCFTKQGDGSLVVAFLDRTLEVTTAGTVLDA